MQNKEKIFSLLGFARRANALAMGHDMVCEAVDKNKSKLIIVCADASDRLKREISSLSQKKNVTLVLADITMNEIDFKIGYKAGVISVNDENFSKRLIELFND